MNRIFLATSYAPTVRADRDKGIIYGVAVITAGIEAAGHNAPPFVTDPVLLQQVTAAINAQPNGVKCRMGHAEVEDVDGLHVMAGKIRNARVDGGVVRADFHAGKGADKDAIERLFWLAEDAPEDAGLSIVPADYEFIEEDGELHLRVKSMFAVDWVGVPAANPAGMLSKSQGNTPGKAIAMKLNAAQIAFLKTVGLADGATEEDMKKLVDGLNPEMKAQFSAIPGDSAHVVAPVAQAAAPAAAAPAPVAASAAAAPLTLTPAGPTPASLAEVRELATLAGYDAAWVVDMLALSKPVDDIRKIALAKKAADATGKAPPVSTIQVGDDQNRVSLRAAIPDAIMLRGGHAPKTPHARASELRGLSFVDMTRHLLASIGVRDAFMMSKVDVVKCMSRRFFQSRYPALAGAQATADFDNILADTINKSLRKAYVEGPATWNQWATKKTAPDFKTIRSTALLGSASLEARLEGQNLVYAAISDSGETCTLAEYHGGIRITHRALVNDDLDALTSIPKKMGDAAKRNEDDVAYALLNVQGATMADAGAVFNATAVTTAGGHANWVDSGAAPTTATLGTAFAAMFSQKSGKLGTGGFLELRPKFALVGPAMEYVMKAIISSAEVRDTTASTKIGTKNPFQDSLITISSARLGAQALGATQWILVADPNVIECVNMYFLEGEEEPVLSQETDFDTDDVKFKVRQTLVGKVVDFRGLYKNDGA